MHLGLSSIQISKMQQALIPIFSAALTTSLVPDVAVGGGTPNYSRSTVKSIFDHEGVLRTLAANEAGFWGARRVANLAANSQTFAGWALQQVALVPSQSDPFGGTTASKLNDNATTNFHYLQQAVSIVPANRTFCFSIDLKLSDPGMVPSLQLVTDTASAGSSVSVDLAAQTIGTPGTFGAGVISTAGRVLLPNGWARYYVTLFVAANTGTIILARIFTGGGSYLGTGTGFLIGRGQIEDITGQSAATPNEYVSTNVLSPPYQGANADGVQNFNTVRLHTQNLIQNDTDTLIGSGFAGIAGGTQVQSTEAGSPLPSGLASKCTDDATNVNHRVFSAAVVGYPATLDSRWTASVYVKAGTMDNGTFWLTDGSFSTRAGITFNLTTQTFTADHQSVTNATILSENVGNGWWRLTTSAQWGAVTGNQFWIGVYFKNASTTSYVGTGQTMFLAGMQFRQSAPSFSSAYVRNQTTAAVGPTDTGITAAIPATTLLGWLPEPAATQLVTPSAAIRDMTNGGWTLGATMTRALTATGVDGVANSATRLTAGAVAATNIITQSLVGAAVARTYSCYIRRINGTGPVRLTQDNFGTGPDISGLLVAGQWVRVGHPTTQLNPVFGIKVDTNGDIIEVDFNQMELQIASISATSPIATTTTRNPDSLTYPATGNIDFANGTAYLEYSVCDPSMNGSWPFYVAGLNGGATANEIISVFNAGATSFIKDGVNSTQNTGGSAFTAKNQTRKACNTWGAGNMTANATGGTAGSTTFAGNFGTTSAIAVGSFGSTTGSPSNPMRNLRIYAQKFTAAQRDAMVA